MAIIPARNARSACDRCYQLKERCDRASSTSPCERCSRLDQPCLTVRPVRPIGRCRTRLRSNNASKSARSGNRAQCKHPIDVWLQKVPNLSLEEKELLMLLLGDSKNLQYPVISPRFQHAEQQSFSGPLPAAWPVLKDAYLAYASVLKSLQTGLEVGTDDASKLRHASAAMVALRSLPITNPKEAELCLTLGFALALSVYGTIGVGVSDICHYCLSVTRPFIEAAAIDPEMEHRVSVLVLLETMECMVHRRKPTLRMQPRAPTVVDRHLGLCLPLLPEYHDLCVISHSLVNSADAACLGALHQQLDGIQARVQKWQPSQPEGFIRDFSTAEVLHLLAQARVYRLAALLVVHRLRHRFGEEDSQADIWSREVMLELELAQRISGHPVRFVALPFIVAAVEVKDPAERVKVLENVDQYVDQLTPVVQKATRTFFTRVWYERDTVADCSWFDSVHKPCVVLNSIGATFSGHVFAS